MAFIGPDQGESLHVENTFQVVVKVSNILQINKYIILYSGHLSLSY
jgi:hypothetical protein